MLSQYLPPPPSITRVAYLFKAGFGCFHSILVETGEPVRRGEPITSWGGHSISFKDSLTSGLIQKFTGRDVTKTRLLSPIDGVMEWNRSNAVNTNWEDLTKEVDRDSSQYRINFAARIRPYADQSKSISIASAYDELIAFAERHKNSFSVRHDQEYQEGYFCPSPRKGKSLENTLTVTHPRRRFIYDVIPNDCHKKS